MNNYKIRNYNFSSQVNIEEIQVYNSTGKLVKPNSLSSTSSGKVSVDMTNIGAGLYAILINTSEGIYTTQIMLK